MHQEVAENKFTVLSGLGSKYGRVKSSSRYSATCRRRTGLFVRRRLLKDQYWIIPQYRDIQIFFNWEVIQVNLSLLCKRRKTVVRH